MPISKANQRAVNKYVKANYDRVNVTMPRGRKDEIRAHAQAQGESVNAFINRAIDHEMERDGGSNPQGLGGGAPGRPGVVSPPPEAEGAALPPSEGK